MDFIEDKRWDRRDVLKAGLGLAVPSSLATLGVNSSNSKESQIDSGEMYSSHSIESVLEYLGSSEDQNQLCSSQEYNIVLNDGNYSVIKEETRNQKEAFNVSYGIGPNLDALVKDYKKVYAQLGENLGKALFIGKTPENQYVLFYRRAGDRSSTYDVAQNHRKTLKTVKLSASIRREQNDEVVYNESMFLDETEIFIPKPKEVIVAKRKVATATDLELEIEDYIGNLRRKGVIPQNENTAWSVYDYTLGEKLVSINEDTPMQAASMMKPFVALAFFQKVKEGGLKYGTRSKAELKAMFQRSSNPSTNWAMRHLGGPEGVQKILELHFGGLFEQTQIVEYIPQNGRTYKNQASAHDYSRFLYALWNNNLPHSKELKRLLALGKDRIYTGVKSIPSGTLVYNKTGSTAMLCGDMGILCPKGKDKKRYPYSLVGIIEKNERAKNYRDWKAKRSNVIRGVSAIVYNEMKRRHNLT